MMTSALETTAGFVSAVVSAIFGSVTLPAIAWLADSAAGDAMPDWIKWLLGPLGALVGMILAIRWLTARLDKAETREQTRQTERDAQLKVMVETTVRNSDVIEQNSAVLGAVKALVNEMRK